MAHTADDGSLIYRRGIAVLEQLLAALPPQETALLPNYSNPFNPETWIPYRLAHAADVTLTIYDTKGASIRRLDLGHQLAGYYANRAKAAYWDGRSETGEPVASGVYFYNLSAGDYSATRKMLILKQEPHPQSMRRSLTDENSTIFHTHSLLVGDASAFTEHLRPKLHQVEFTRRCKNTLGQRLDNWGGSVFTRWESSGGCRLYWDMDIRRQDWRRT